MAFGFPPKYEQTIPLEGSTPEHFLTLMVEAAKQAEFNIGSITQNGFTAYSNFSMQSWSEEINVTIDAHQATLKSECVGNQIADWGKNKKNIEGLIASYQHVKTIYPPEELDQKYKEIEAGHLLDENGEFKPSATNKKGKITNVIALFKPTNGYFITPIIIDLNIIIFILMIISGVNFMLPDNESIIRWGANFGPLTLGGQWWRLLTNCFIHIGVLHLLLNMYALVYIGLLLEPHLGKARFLAAYLLTGLVASLTSLWWHNLTISAGASGAIFGMYGVFLAMLTTNLIDKATRKALLTSIVVFVGYNLVNGLKEGIDNAAHIGGLASGLIIGYAYIPSLKKSEDQNSELKTVGLITLAVLIISGFVFKKIPDDINTYDTRIKKFADMESMAMEVYQMPKTTPKDSLLSEIKDRGIYYWNENINLINSLDSLKLPDVIHERDKKLIEYCNLRIKSYNLIYKSVDENTDKYKDQIISYNKQIQSIINELGNGEKNK